MMRSNDEMIRQHYREQAEKHGNSRSSTMEDEIIREKETQLICGLFSLITRKLPQRPRVLDLGCGNGHMTMILAERFPEYRLFGVDYSEDLLAIARDRELPGVEFMFGDARSLEFEDEYFDAVYTQRCLINILDEASQLTAANEIARVLKQGGFYLMLEAFTDGLAALNKAREECDLEPIAEAYHNRYIDKQAFFPALRQVFQITDPVDIDVDRGAYLLPSNFLSSHYFVSRVLYPFIAKGKWKRNTEFAKFFSFLPPIGNYSPIQSFVLKKR